MRSGKRANSEFVIYESFMQLGGVYVKFLQLMMLRSKFFSKLSAAQKMAVYDGVAVDEIDIHRFMESQFGSDYMHDIVQIDTEPFAGGSFAQVYSARHADGNRLIIKVLRPSLIANIKADLRVLNLIFLFMRRRMKVATDMKALFKNFKQVVLEETDYIAEANNAVYFRNYFSDKPDIFIPQTYTDYCTRGVIVQEFVEGLAMTDLIEAIEMGHDAREYTKQVTGSDLDEQVSVLGHELIMSLFVADRVFGDPHPGNIKLLPNNQVGMIDFGIAGEPPEDRRALMILLQDVVNIINGEFDEGVTFINGMRFFTSDLYRAVNTISQSFESDDGTTIVDEIMKTSSRALQSNEARADIESLVRKGEISKIMNQVINQDNRFGLNVALDSGATVAMRTADGYLAVIESLKLTDDLIPEVMQVGIDRVYEQGFLLKGHPETMEYEIAVNIVSGWAQTLIESDPIFFAGLIKKLRMASRNKRPVVQDSDTVSNEMSAPVLSEENE